MHIVRLTPGQVATLIVFMAQAYDQERGKTTSRFRVSYPTLRVLSKRQRLRVSFVEDCIDELASLGWCAFTVGDGFGLVQTSAVENWPRIGTKRIREMLRRIAGGDEDALIEVAGAVSPSAALEEADED